MLYPKVNPAYNRPCETYTRPIALILFAMTATCDDKTPAFIKPIPSLIIKFIISRIIISMLLKAKESY